MRYADAAYRNKGPAPAGAPGFQRPIPPYRPPGLPANDNVPRPANDNRPRALRGLKRGKLYPLIRGLLWLYGQLQGKEQWQLPREDMSGWTLQANCGAKASPWLSGSNVNCFIGGSYPNPNSIPPPRKDGSFWWIASLQAGYTTGLFYSGDNAEVWNTPDQGFNPGVPGMLPHWPVRDPFAPTTPMPSVDPFIVPPSRPFEWPRPIPWRVLPQVRPNPWRAPQEQPSRGPARSPRRQPKPRTKPYEVPSKGIEIVVSPQGAIAVRPRTKHKRLPPRRGEPERKARIGAQGLLAALAGGITEGLDALDAIWWALPEGTRKGCYAAGRKDGSWFTPQEKAACIAANADKIDLEQAAINLALNQIQDAVIGALSPTDRLDWTGRSLGGYFKL